MDPPPRFDATRSNSFEERRRDTSFGWGMFVMILIAQFIAMSAAFGFTFLGTYAPQVVIGGGASPVLIMRGRNTASIGAITGASISSAGVGGAGTSGASVGVANIGAASVSLPCANFGAIEAAESNSAIMVERLSRRIRSHPRICGVCRALSASPHRPHGLAGLRECHTPAGARAARSICRGIGGAVTLGAVAFDLLAQ
jgi:hypothetical protein